jgi:hypothetical protein
MPLAAPGVGQPRPIGRLGRADRPYQGLAFDTGGGHWCKQLNGWIFPEAKREQVVAAMGDDISEEQVVHAPKPSVDANATLLVSRHKKATLVTGETIKVKTQLSLLKGSWNKALAGWIFPAGSKDAVLELLRQDPTNQVEDDFDEAEPVGPAAGQAEAGAEAPPAKKKAKKEKKRKVVADDDEDEGLAL